MEWLLAHSPVGARWCLIHATHLTAAERKGIAASGAVAGLCPITEANLGDGLFPAAEFQSEGGVIGVGTDSNVNVTAAGELSLLEYGQRLSRRQRNVLTGGEGSTGAALFNACLRGGAQALGADPAPTLSRRPADLVALADKLALPPAGDQALDRWIFAGGLSVADVWAAGKHVVQGGCHAARAQVERLLPKHCSRFWRGKGQSQRAGQKAASMGAPVFAIAAASRVPVVGPSVKP